MKTLTSIWQRVRQGASLQMAVALGVLLLTGGLVLQAQDASPPPQRQSEMLESFRAFVDSLSAPPEYVREAFTYRREGRIDPVVPPAAVMEGAFPGLTLTGIVFEEENPARSYAIMRVALQDGMQRYVVREGDEFDQYRILRIEPDAVVINERILGGWRERRLEH